MVYDPFPSGHCVSSLSDPLACSSVAPKQILNCVYERFPRVFVPAFCIFVCGLFNDDVSITDYVVSGRINGEKKIGKDEEGSSHTICV